MTNDKNILARLDELTAEVRQTREAVQACVQFQENLEPLLHDRVGKMVNALDSLERRFEPEDVHDMVGQLLASSKNMVNVLKMLDRTIEFKEDFEPYSKAMFKELTEKLQTSLQGFEAENLQELIHQFIVNMGNIAEGLKMLGSFMEMKKDAGALSKQAFDEAVARLEDLQQRGVFTSLEHVVRVAERVGTRLQSVDFDKARPIRGVFGLISAMRRSEVQEGMGVLLELATVMTALKQEEQSLKLSV